MLRGNWFKTVGDLRNLTEQDAEKLEIPHQIYSLIRLELPKQGSRNVVSFSKTELKVLKKQKKKYLFCYRKK